MVHNAREKKNSSPKRDTQVCEFVRWTTSNFHWCEGLFNLKIHTPPLADSGGGGGTGGARPPPFEIPKRIFKRDPPKTFVPAALAVAAAPPPPFPQILDPPLPLSQVHGSA